MTTLTNSSSRTNETQEKEIRALAIQAAATWASTGTSRAASDTVLDIARDFENYIETGNIPTDKADDLDIDGMVP